MVSVQTGASFLDSESAGVPMVYPQNKRKDPDGGVRSSALERTATIEFERGAPVSVDEVKRWYDLQVPYANLAKDKKVAERALQYVTGHRHRYEETTAELRDKWRAHQYMLRGHTLSRFSGLDALHVAEMYKALELLTPLIEEALMQYDPPFAIRGKEALDRTAADHIRHFIESQLSATRWKHLMQPNIRAALVYAFSAFKIYWDVETQRVIERNVERQEQGDKVSYKHSVEEVEKVIWWGPRIKLVDPLSFFIDSKSIEPPHDAIFVGDSTYMTLEEIKMRAKLQGWLNTDKLKGRTPQNETGFTQFDKRVRDLEFLYEETAKKPPPGTPHRYKVTNCWGLFDPYGEGNAVQFNMTTVDDSVCVECRENHHDDKHKPYAIVRLGRDGYGFFTVGPMDHALKTNMEIDEHENLMLRGHANSVSPQVWVEDASELPDHVYEGGAGKVWESKSPPTWFAPKPVIGEGIALRAHLAKDIEEYTGAYRIHESPAQTATEVERKVQVRNMRVRDYVNGVSLQIEEVLRQIHSLNRQWVTRDMNYTILGKGGAALSDVYEIGPEHIQHDVDFEMLGPSNLRFLGLRSTNLATFLNLVYPILEKYPGDINIKALILDLYKDMVGTRPGDEILVALNLAEVLDQVDENKLLRQGQSVAVHPADDDENHMGAMAPYLPEGDRRGELQPDAERAVDEHYAAHEAQARTKAARQLAAASSSPITTMPQQEDSMDAGRGTTGTRRDMGGANGVTPPGEAPGPPSMNNAAAADRRPTNPQTENML